MKLSLSLLVISLAPAVGQISQACTDDTTQLNSNPDMIPAAQGAVTALNTAYQNCKAASTNPCTIDASIDASSNEVSTRCGSLSGKFQPTTATVSCTNPDETINIQNYPSCFASSCSDADVTAFIEGSKQLIVTSLNALGSTCQLAGSGSGPSFNLGGGNSTGTTSSTTTTGPTSAAVGSHGMMTLTSLVVGVVAVVSMAVL